ncbi:MAG: ABC transporter ATP-binding protein [Lachnospiraceae bacterium]|nr:ABC transporter ATP-binding protein [Lachnospiraceae bacterium]
MAKAVEARNLTKIYGEKENRTIAVDHMDMSVEEAEYVAVVGASGSGKSTLLHMIGGLESYTEGKLLVCGESMDMGDEKLSAFRRQKIGFIYQQFHLFPQLTVYQNIVLPAMVNKSRGYKKRAMELMDYLEIADRKDYLPSKLSGGQQQRAAIARALITDAKIILADEPTGNLDSVSAQKVKELLERIHREFQVALIVVTHDQSYADRAERKIEMLDGRLKQAKN